MQSGHHIISISLGAAVGPTGLAVVEPRTEYWHPKGNERGLDSKNHFDVLWLERLDHGLPYPAIVARVRNLAAEKRLSRGCSILVDVTKTGSPPLRVFEDHGLYPEPIEITTTAEATYLNGVQHLPYRDMIGAGQVALQTDQLKVASELDLAATLVSDLQAIDPTMTGRAPDTGQNVDLVTAVSLAVWWADRLQWSDEVAAAMRTEDDGEFYGQGRDELTGY